MASYAADKPGHTEAALTARTPDVGGDGWLNDGATMFRCTNTSGSPITVTFNAAGSCSFGFDHDVAVTVPATTGDVWVGPFSTKRFNDSNGYVQLTYSGVTNLTIYALSTGGTVTGVA